MKRKLFLVTSLTNVTFLDKARVGNIQTKRVKNGVMTKADEQNLVCYEMDTKTKIIWAIVRI